MTPVEFFGALLLGAGFWILFVAAAATITGICWGVADIWRITHGQAPKHSDPMKGRRLGPHLDRENEAETIRIEEKKER